MAEFEVFVSKEDFKFNCAHFIIYEGFRERIHGHNYQLAVKITGSDVLSADGYLIDFGDVKKVTRSLCKSLNEYFICPAKSPHIKISEKENSYCLECSDGSSFQLPKGDVAMLPLFHSSAEELAHYFLCTIMK
jgi:6-pyruvoyl-tetrahydropterin synthase